MVYLVKLKDVTYAVDARIHCLPDTCDQCGQQIADREATIELRHVTDGKRLSISLCDLGLLDRKRIEADLLRQFKENNP